MDYKRKAHSVYLMTYHIVFVTKYKKPVLSDEIGDFYQRLVYPDMPRAWWRIVISGDGQGPYPSACLYASTGTPIRPYPCIKDTDIKKSTSE